MKLTVQNLSFSYSSVPVLKNMSFSVESGECVAVLGTNGAGKSTLLKCIDRLLPYKQGEITVDGRSVSAMKPTELARIIAYVPQTPAFSAGTVFDAVHLGRMPHMQWGTAEQDMEKTDRLLEQLGLSAVALRNVRQLSGGEQQKVAIARALAQEPQLLLFDEPTSNLDLKNQMETVRLIRQIAKEQNMAVLVTMHDLNLALRFADRFLLMKGNEIYAAGGVEMITSDSIKEVYGQTVSVAKIDGYSVIIPKEAEAYLNEKN